MEASIERAAAERENEPDSAMGERPVFHGREAVPRIPVANVHIPAAHGEIRGESARSLGERDLQLAAEGLQFVESRPCAVLYAAPVEGAQAGVRSEIDARRQGREAMVSPIAESLVEVDFPARRLDPEVHAAPTPAELVLESPVDVAQLAVLSAAEVKLDTDAGAEVAHVDEVEFVGSHAERGEIVGRHEGGGGVIPVPEPRCLYNDRIPVAAAQLEPETAADKYRVALVQPLRLESQSSGAERDEWEHRTASEVELELAAEALHVQRTSGQACQERRRRVVVAGEISELRVGARREQVDAVQLDELAEAEPELASVEERVAESGVVREPNALGKRGEGVAYARHLCRRLLRRQRYGQSDTRGQENFQQPAV